MSDTFTLKGDADLSAAQSAVDSFVDEAAARDFTLTGTVDEVDTTAVDSAVSDAEAKSIELEAKVDAVDTSAVDSAVEDVEGRSLDMKKPTIPSPDSSKLNSGLDAVDSRSDQSRSVLANLTGNASQDLGELGGIAGTTGVAIGQLAEYAADGNIALGNLTKVVGPMLAITVAVEVATRAFAAMKARSAELAKNTRELTAAFVEGTGGVDDWAASVDKAVEAGTADPGEAFSASFFEAWDDDKANEVLTALGDMGLAAGDLGDQMVGASGDTAAWAAEQLKAAGATDEQAAQLGALFAQYGEWGDVMAIAQSRQGDVIEGVGQLSDGLGEAAVKFEGAGRGLETIADAAGDVDMEKAATDALNAAEGIEQYAGMVAQARSETDTETEALRRFQDLMVDANAERAAAEEAAKAQAEADAEVAKQLEEAAAGADAFAVALNSVDYKNVELEAASTAMSTYSEALFAAGNQAQASQGAYNKLGAALTDTALSFDTTTEAGAAQQDAMEQLAGVIDTDLAAAFDAADGDLATFGRSAQGIRTDVLAKLQNELGLTADEAAAVAEALGLTDRDIEARFRLAGAEEARMKLGLLQGAMEGLPPDVERQVTLAVAAGDYTTALKIVEDYYKTNQPEVIASVDADTDPFVDRIGREVAHAEGDEVVLPANADVREFETEVEEASDEAEATDTTMPVDADTGEAEAGISEVEQADYQATIDALAETAAAAKALLDTTSKTRIADIVARGLTRRADEELAALERTRTAFIEAVALTASAEAELNNTARTRHSYVYQHSLGGFGGGGSSSRAAPAGLGAAPMAATPAPTIVNLSLSAAVIGDRYDVQRVVTRALRGAQRLAGARLARAEGSTL